MSLINQMLKDLEKRRSRDLETSSSLSDNITWETRPNQKEFNWIIFSIVLILIMLMSVIAYLLWERTTEKEQYANTVIEKKHIATSKNNKVKKTTIKVTKEKTKKKIKKIAVVSAKNISEYENAVDVEEIDDSVPIKVKKIHRPLNSKQLAEIAYQKGYRYLQQGRLRQGKEYLREALLLYIPHIKAREMLAGIYIKSGHFINAAELLSEGVKITPEYPLFAKLYARVLLEQNNPKLAIKVLERGSANMAQEPDYYALLAATYQRVKNHKKAIEIYLQLVKINSAASVWWLGLAISLEKSGKNKEALEAYQRAQKTGNLKAGLITFTNNRVSALKEIGFPEN